MKSKRSKAICLRVKKHRISNYHKNRGVTLLESLIAAFIVGVGLLGIAALQIKSLQGAGAAQYRSTASDIASSLSDRMRANLKADNNYSDVSADCSVIVNDCAMVPGTNDASLAVVCSPVELAAYDIKSVFCTKNGEPELPEGTLSVEACKDSDASDSDDCSPNSLFNIVVGWQTRIDVDGSANFTDQVVMTVIPGTDKDEGL